MEHGIGAIAAALVLLRRFRQQAGRQDHPVRLPPDGDDGGLAGLGGGWRGLCWRRLGLLGRLILDRLRRLWPHALPVADGDDRGPFQRRDRLLLPGRPRLEREMSEVTEL